MCKLDLRRCLRLDGVEALAAGSLPALVELDLSQCRVHDEGVRILAQSPLMTRLRTLRLTCAELTNTGARLLLEAPAAQKLQALHLEYNGLNKAMQQALKVKFGERVFL